MIFLSYRRRPEGRTSPATFIRERLVRAFGQPRVFWDRDPRRMPPGEPFPRVLEEALARAKVLVAVIAPDWMGEDGQGGARIRQPGDYVRFEVATALRNGIQVLPLLVEGARLPDPSELPEDLRDLTDRNFLEIHDRSLDHDLDLLVSRVRRSGVARRTRPATQFSIALIALVVTLFVLVGRDPSSEPAGADTPAWIRFGDESYSVQRGRTVPLQIEAERSSSMPLRVEVRCGGNARRGRDYELARTMVTLPAGERFVTIEVHGLAVEDGAPRRQLLLEMVGTEPSIGGSLGRTIVTIEAHPETTAAPSVDPNPPLVLPNLTLRIDPRLPRDAFAGALYDAVVDQVLLPLQADLGIQGGPWGSVRLAISEGGPPAEGSTDSDVDLLLLAEAQEPERMPAELGPDLFRARVRLRARLVRRADTTLAELGPWPGLSDQAFAYADEGLEAAVRDAATRARIEIRTHLDRLATEVSSDDDGNDEQ